MLDLRPVKDRRSPGSGGRSIVQHVGKGTNDLRARIRLDRARRSSSAADSMVGCSNEDNEINE